MFFDARHGRVLVHDAQKYLLAIRLMEIGPSTDMESDELPRQGPDGAR